MDAKGLLGELDEEEEELAAVTCRGYRQVQKILCFSKRGNSMSMAVADNSEG
jgi:hypothetical protein